MGIKEFQKELKKKKMDFALFYNLDSMNYDEDILYFSGYKGIGALVIPKNKKAFLAVPEMEYERAKKNKIKVYKWSKKKKLFEFILYIINKNTRENPRFSVSRKSSISVKIKKKKIGINKNVFTLNVYRAFKKSFKKNKIIDIYGLCEEVREIKSNEEIKIIKKTCNITDKIFYSLIKNIKNDNIKKELEIVKFLEKETKKHNCELAFKPVVASGKSSSIPHYEPKNIKLKKGFCVIDFGVKFKNYNSDISRTIYFGKPSNKEKELYYFLLNIQKNTIKNIKINENCGKIYNNAKKELKKYKKYFIHGLGHGVGIKVHELPNLTESSKGKIKEDMVFTVEPGIYFKNKFGLRIEDTVLMKNKAVPLTKATKDLLTV